MADAAQTISEAFELIEQGDLTAARELLEDIRADNEKNPDFWWVFSHAVDSEDDGRDALQRVLALNPDYPGARALSQQLGMAPVSSIRRLAPARGTPPPPPGLPVDDFDADFDDDLDEFDEADFEFDGEGEGGSRRRNLMLLVVLIIIIVVVGIVALPGLMGGGKATPQPTAIVDQATLAPTIVQATMEVVQSSEPPPTETALAEDLDYAELAAQLSQFDVPPNGIQVQETGLGSTLVISTCAAPGPAASQSIGNVVDALQAVQISDEITGLAFSITNCSEESVVRVVGVARTVFESFVTGDLTRQEFQRALQPIN